SGRSGHGPGAAGPPDRLGRRGGRHRAGRIHPLHRGSARGLPWSRGAGHRGGGPRVAGPWERRVPAPGRVRSRPPGRGAAAARGGGAGHRSGGVVRGDGMTGAGQGEGGGSPKVSPFAVPLLLGGVILGFVAGYVFLWWGLLLVGVVVLAAAAM